MSKQHSHSSGRVVIAIGLLLLAAGCQETHRARTEVDAYSSFVKEGGNIEFPADFPNGYVFIGS